MLQPQANIQPQLFGIPNRSVSNIGKYTLTIICKKLIYEFNLWYVDENQSGQTNDTVEE